MTMTDPGWLERVRAIALALPEAHEVEAWEHPTFRVKDKIFAIFAGEPGKSAALTVKVGHEMQAVMIQDPRFVKAPYLGRGGWISFGLDGRVPAEEVAHLVGVSYRLIAPKRLVRLLAEPRTEDAFNGR